MTQVCRIHTRRKISYAILSLIPLIISISIFHSALSAAHVEVFSLIMGIVLLAIPVLVVINTFRKKVIVEADRITYVSLFFKKQLLFRSIKGHRIGFKNIYLEASHASDPTIVIYLYRDLENGYELVRWIREAFEDLNMKGLVSQRSVALTNAKWGATEEAREKSVESAHTLSLIYNVVSFPLVLILILYMSKVSLVLLLAYPFVGILLMLSGRGLIKFQSDKKRSICSFVALGIFAPALALMLKSLAEDDVLDTAHLWIPAFGICVLLFVLIYKTGINRSLGILRYQIITMLITALLYGFGGALQLNRQFDPSRPIVYNVAVLESHENTSSAREGTDKSYSLTISSWGPRHEAEAVSVPGSLYWRTHEGDTIQVHLGQGLLQIPWFVVSIDKEKKN